MDDGCIKPTLLIGYYVYLSSHVLSLKISDLESLKYWKLVVAVLHMDITFLLLPNQT